MVSNNRRKIRWRGKMRWTRKMDNIKKILCATDLSKASKPLIARGIEFCLRFDASFFIFHAVQPPRGSVARQIEFERGGEKKEAIESAREKLKKRMEGADIKWDSAITYGDPVLETAKAATKVRADIVIAASLGLSGFQQFLMGSVVGRMAQTLLQPLLVIPPQTDSGRSKLSIKNIVIACGLRESDSYLKKYALAFSEKFTSKICLVHVMESPVNEKLMAKSSGHYDQMQNRLAEKLSLRLKKFMPGTPHILHGVPGEELSVYAKNHGADLIIAGIDDRPDRIITTTTAALLRQLPCAVLTIPLKF